MIPAEKARGCLLGLAVGDALGRPLRGLKAGRVAQLFGPVEGHIDAREAWITRPHRWAMPGAHSAAAQIALSVADCFQHGQRVEPEALRAHWSRALHHPDLKAQRFGVFRDPSPSLVRALRAAAAGELPSQRAEGPTCEAALLAPAIALLHGGDLSPMGGAIESTALLLSDDPRAIAGAMAVGHLCAMLLQGVDALSAAECLSGRVREAEEALLIEHLGELDLSGAEDEFDRLHAMSRALEAIPGLVREGDDDLAVRTLLRQGHHLAPSAPVSSVNANYPLTTLPVLIFLALAHHRFAEPVSRIAGEGKESALCAGLLGALLGARLGEEAIPAEWRSGLRAHREVASLADGLSGAAAPSGEAWFDVEAALTSREAEARRPLIAAAEKERLQAPARKGKPPSPAGRPEEPMPFPPPPQTYLGEPDDPRRKQRERAARGRKRISWKEERRKRRDG